MAVTGSTWLVRGICGCYGVYVTLSSAKIALHGYGGGGGTDLREGVTAASDPDYSSTDCDRSKHNTEHVPRLVMRGTHSLCIGRYSRNNAITRIS